jgi:hypothetical protein
VSDRIQRLIESLQPYTETIEAEAGFDAVQAAASQKQHIISYKIHARTPRKY